MAINADWLTRPMEIRSDARYIIVVEKDGVFNRMVEDGFHDRYVRSTSLHGGVC